MYTSDMQVQITYDPNFVAPPWGREPEVEYVHCGYAVSIGDERLQYLTSASRRVFVSHTLGVVVKFGGGWGVEQCWDEFHTYHDVLDDEARAVTAEVLDFGVVLVDKGDGARPVAHGYTVQRFVPNLVRGDEHRSVATYVDGCSIHMQDHRMRVSEILRNKYGLSDLHAGNLCWDADSGCIMLVDLGISDKYVTKSRTPDCFRSDRVAQAWSSIPEDTRASLAH